MADISPTVADEYRCLDRMRHHPCSGCNFQVPSLAPYRPGQSVIRLHVLEQASEKARPGKRCCALVPGIRNGHPRERCAAEKSVPHWLIPSAISFASRRDTGTFFPAQATPLTVGAIGAIPSRWAAENYPVVQANVDQCRPLRFRPTAGREDRGGYDHYLLGLKSRTRECEVPAQGSYPPSYGRAQGTSASQTLSSRHTVPHEMSLVADTLDTFAN